jgi:hypothetical protein
MPMVGESLERVIAKTMPNSEVKLEILVEAFKALNPTHFSQDGKSLGKTNTALKIPNQNQLANMVEAQLGDKQMQLTSTSAQALADAKAQELKGQAKGMLAGTKTATPKINPKTESWVRFPSKMMALSKKVEGWVRFPNAVPASATTAEWVRYPSVGPQDLDIMGVPKTAVIKSVDQRDWVRYQVAKAEMVAD